MRRHPLTLLAAALIVATAVAAYLAATNARLAAAPAPGCALPAATWDQQEPATSFAVAGDSLLGQAGPVLTALAEQRCHTVTLAARSGGAPCDLLPTYGAAMSAAPGLRRVMLAWVGNVGASPCMVTQMGDAFGTARWGADPNGPATLTAAEVDHAGYLYEVALRAMVRWDLDRGVQTVLVMPPPMRAGTYHRQMEAELLGRYAAIGAAYGGVWTTGAPRAVLGGDTWQESVGGLRVRHTDLTHLYAPFGTQLWAAGIVDAAVTP